MPEMKPDDQEIVITASKGSETLAGSPFAYSIVYFENIFALTSQTCEKKFVSFPFYGESREVG